MDKYFFIWKSESYKIPLALYYKKPKTIFKHLLLDQFDHKKNYLFALDIEKIKKAPFDTSMKAFILNEYLGADTSNFSIKCRAFVENAHLQQNVLPNTIVLMTEVVWGTLGDFYAGMKLCTALKKLNPSCKIIWLIMEVSRTIPTEQLPCDEYYIYNTWSELLLGKADQTNLLFNAEVVVQFPTFHFFPEQVMQVINHLRTIQGLQPIINVLEYDYVMGYTDSSSHSSVKTGFNDNALGVFLEDNHPSVELSREMVAQTPIGQQLFIDTFDMTAYQNKYACYFGYRNKATASNYINSVSFILLALAFHDKSNDPRRHIDIIVPLTPTEESNLQSTETKAMLQRYNIQRVNILHPENETRHINLTSKNNGVELRILNYFPFPNAIFRALINIAEKNIMLCTGDQSFSDVLSMGNVIPVYQIMHWKQELYHEFLHQVENLCGPLSPLYIFLHEFSPHLGNSIHYDLLAEHLAFHHDQMHADMLIVTDYFRAHKNLYQTLPQQLNQHLGKNTGKRLDNLPFSSTMPRRDKLTK